MADAQTETVDSPERDYPYYRGWPVELSTAQWLIALAAVVLAAGILVGRLPIFAQGSLWIVPSILLAIIPLLGLALVAGKSWTALFRKVRPKDIGWMFVFAALNYVVSLAVGLLTMDLLGAESNAGIHSLVTMSDGERTLFFLVSIPQLIGEELVSIIPFLAILYFLTSKAGMSRTGAVIIAWLATAVWFAAIHLPTYNWNILQCLILIGGARLVLTLAYIKTKNLWVSAGAHIINDWTTFILVIVGAAFGHTG